ncbi:MAG: hypothetical protein IIZ67_03155 [Bacilli bacterium]|nr:hypothetical protein [Bacilli bacterium]
MKVLDRIEDVSILVGSAIGLSQIQTLLGIIILIFQLAIIIYKCVIKIIEHFKNKNYKQVVEELEKAKEELEKLKEGNNNG